MMARWQSFILLVIASSTSFLVYATLLHKWPVMDATTVVLLSISILLLKTLYSVLIYPFYISPLRHLPTVSPSQWVQTSDSSPIQWDKWFRTVQNRGLIRYFGLYNTETLLVTSPETIQEVLSNT